MSKVVEDVAGKIPEVPDVTIPAKKIKVQEFRGRQDFEYVEQLAASIKEHGLIHPIMVVPLEDGNYRLVAGEQRFKAMLRLGILDIPCYIRAGLDDIQQRAIELEENIKRKELSWPEKARLTAELHRLKTEEHGIAERGPAANPVLEGSEKPTDNIQLSKSGWKNEDTAKSLNKSSGMVSRELRMAKLMEERPDLLTKVKDKPFTVAEREIKKILKAEEFEAKRDQLPEIDIKLHHCDAIAGLRKLPSDSVDLVVCDPPYGYESINQHSESKGTKQRTFAVVMNENDNEDMGTVSKLLAATLSEFQRVLKPSAHFYICFNIELYPFLWTQLKILPKLEFAPNPLIWYKDTNTSPFGGFNYMSSCEFILYGWKKPKEKRLRQGYRDVITIKPTPADQRIHVFQKPQQLLEILIQQSSNPGDLVLDPFAGSGSTLITASEMQRSAIGFEKNEKNYQLAMSDIIEAKKLLQPSTIDSDER